MNSLVLTAATLTWLGTLGSPSSPPSQLEVVEEALAYGLATAGASLQTAMPLDQDVINDSVLLSLFSVASSEAAARFSEASGLLAAGLPYGDPALLLFQPRVDATAVSLNGLSLALGQRDFDGVQDALDELSGQFRWYAAASDELLEHGVAADFLRDAADEFESMSRSYRLIGPNTGWPGTQELLLSVVEASSYSQDQLQQLRDEALSISDPAIVAMANFDDVDLLLAVWNMVSLVQSPDYQVWVANLADDPQYWMEELVIHGNVPGADSAGASLLAAGLDLFAGAGTDMPAIPGCNSVCGPEGPDCPGECEMCQSGIGTGLQNPDDCDEINDLLDLLAEIPGLMPTPAAIPAPLSRVFSWPTSADPKGVTDAMKALMATLKAKRPELWIKVCWEECTAHGCGFLWLSTEYLCDAKESEWIQVPAPKGFGGQYPPLSSWNQGSAPQQIADAASKVEEEACEGH